MFVFFFKQKTAYEMRISDWSSDVCSSDLTIEEALEGEAANGRGHLDDGKARGAAIGQAHLLEFLPEQLPLDELAGAADPGQAFGKLWVAARAEHDFAHRERFGLLVEFPDMIDQLGRASCRERVGQYELIWVV